MYSSSSETITAGSPPEFRLFLQEELARRCKKNPRFSLRAFARTLDVEASALSKILNGKRSLTPKMLHRMCSQLGIEATEVSRYEQTLSAARPVRRPLGERGARRLTTAFHDPAALTGRASRERLAEAAARLAAFRDELRSFLEQDAGEHSENYRLSLVLSPSLTERLAMEPALRAVPPAELDPRAP